MQPGMDLSWTWASTLWAWAWIFVPLFITLISSFLLALHWAKIGWLYLLCFASFLSNLDMILCLPCKTSVTPKLVEMVSSKLLSLLFLVKFMLLLVV